METKGPNDTSIDSYYLKFFKNFFYSSIIVGLSLLIGIVGYHYIAGLAWIDAILNASMILTGMGPVNPMLTTGGKLFSSFYALFSGIAFLSTMAVFLSPVLHRFMCSLHLDGDK